MKRIISSAIVLLAVALGSIARAQTFTSGNLVIYRLGGDANGNASAGPGGTLSNFGSTIWLDEYTTGGSFVRSHMMPTNYFGGNSPMIGAGTTFGSGLITRSVDGRFIVACGYGATIGQLTNFTLESEFGTEAPRVIGLADGNGHVFTTTTLTNSLAADEIRSATSPEGTNFWLGGDTDGVRFTTRGAADCVQLSTFDTNIREVMVVSNTLYFASGSGSIRIGTVGTQPPPMTNGSFEATLPNVATNFSPFCFVLFNLTGGSGPDTLYFADSTSSAIIKYSLVAPSTNWVNNGAITIGGAIGLTAQTRIVGTTTNVDLFTTGGGGTLSGSDSLWATTDSGGFNAAPVQTGNNPFIPIATSANGVSFRGIAFAPVGGEAFPSGAGTLSVGPVLDYFSDALVGCAFPDTQTYSLANFGTTPINWTATADQPWITFTPAGGNLGTGGSITVVASFNAGAASLPVGTNTAVMTFANTSNGNGTTMRNVRLILDGQDISPSGDFVSAGQPTGPFAPTNQVYTLTNGATAINWSASKSSPGDTWFTITPASGTLPSCGSATVTFSLNANANALAIGNYGDVVTFSNTTAGTVIDTRNANLQVGSTFFCDDFSTFIQNTPVAGQKGWLSASGSLSQPTVTNNAVYVAAAQAVAAEEPYKNFPTTSNGFVYVATVITVTSAPPVTVSPSYALATWNLKNGPVLPSSSNAFGLYRFSVRDTGTNQFLFCIRSSAQGATPYTFDSTPRNYGTPYRIIIQTDPAKNSNTWVYVNPSSSTLGTNMASLVATTTTAFYQPDLGVSCVQFGNTFGSATSIQPGVAFSKVCITTNFADAFNDIGGAPATDPFTTWQNQYFTPAELANPAFSGPNADPLGKGMSNTNQFLAGFNPTNGAAYLHVLSIVRTNTGTDVFVSYLGANGNSSTTPPMASRTNVLEFTAGVPPSGSYTSNSFVSTGQTNILSGGTGLGAVSSMVDPGGATNKPSRYYRVRVLVP